MDRKTIFNIKNLSLREYIATGGLVFAIISFKMITSLDFITISNYTNIIFYGIFYGVAMLLFGADVNPSLTFARWIKGDINYKIFFIRIFMQFAGAMSALFVLGFMNYSYADMGFSIVQPDKISAIDITIIEGVMSGLLVVVVFGMQRQTYKPAITAVVYIFAIYYTLPLYTSYLNLLFVVPSALMTNSFSWHIIYFLLGHLMGVFIMVIFWIKDIWSE